ncbi:MAG TPA: hypothetical protein VD866_02675 [Urbifossiella sp.]|nr:hypothetical protein [Urbifossiella sp.]
MAALRGLAETVGHFHRMDPAIVHRDLKPSNILVDAATGRLKVGDFGIGAVSARRLLDGETNGTANRAGRFTAVRGSYTLLYASPQQRAGSKLLDPRDDVHALGVIACQMVTGRLDLGAGPDFADDLRDHGASEGLVALLGRCVAQKDDRRPKDAAELAEALAALGGTTEEPPYAEAVEEAAVPAAKLVPPTTPPAAVTKRPNTTLPPLPPGLSQGVEGAVVLHTHTGHTQAVIGVAFGPDGRVATTASTDKTAILWLLLREGEKADWSAGAVTLPPKPVVTVVRYRRELRLAVPHPRREGTAGRHPRHRPARRPRPSRTAPPPRAASASRSIPTASRGRRRSSCASSRPTAAPSPSRPLS